MFQRTTRAIWLDHREAQIIHFNATKTDESVIHPSHLPRHLHAKTGSASGTHQHGDAEFFRDIAKELQSAHLFMVVGPSTAKNEFTRFLEKHDARLLNKLDRVHSMQQVTD